MSLQHHKSVFVCEHNSDGYGVEPSQPPLPLKGQSVYSITCVSVFVCEHNSDGYGDCHTEDPHSTTMSI